jgi:hypothetical protein
MPGRVRARDITGCLSLDEHAQLATGGGDRLLDLVPCTGLGEDEAQVLVSWSPPGTGWPGPLARMSSFRVLPPGKRTRTPVTHQFATSRACGHRAQRGRPA